MRTICRVVAVWTMVVGSVALAVKGMDWLPGLVTGTPQRVRVYSSVGEAEQAIGASLWLPAYYPDTLLWPPARIDAWPGPPTSVALRVSDRESRLERFVLIQSIEAPGEAPAALLDSVLVLDSADVAIGTRTGRLSRVLTSDGQVLHDVSWTHGVRRLTIRFRGPAEQLLLIAESLERARPS
jgi:hypothetical protein